MHPSTPDVKHHDFGRTVARAGAAAGVAVDGRAPAGDIGGRTDWNELQADPKRIEIRLGADGEILVNGVVSPDALKAMPDGLACVEPSARGSR